MAVTTVEAVETTAIVPYLEDSEAEFVSLVDHGAAREPFRVIKKEKATDAESDHVIHAILLPKNTPVESFKSDSHYLNWVADIKTDNIQEFEAWTQYVQLEAKKFDSASFNIHQLGDSGAYAVAGKLKTSVKQQDVPVPPDPGSPPGGVGVVATTSLNGPADNMETPVATDMIPVTYSFSDLFYKELDGFVSIVEGTMSQSVVDPKKRKATIMSALQSFGSFLSMAVDAIGGQTAKLEKSEAELTINDAIKVFNKGFAELKTSITTKVESIDTEVPGGNEEMLFENKEDMKTFIVDTVKEAMKAEKEALDQRAQEQPTAEKTETVDAVENLTKSVANLTETMQKLEGDLKTVAEKQESFEHAVIGSPSPSEDTVRKGEKPQGKFSGIFG